ncbi:MAG TPA: hypothetical protein VH912_25185 [Streptosporangiaceae bacterium]
MLSRMPERWRLPALVYIVCQLLLLAWWAAYYPGLMSYDTIAYVWQVTTDNWMANHSVPYDGLVWLSLQLTGDLALLTLVQTVAAAAVLAYASSVLRDLGVRPLWAGLAAVAVPALPPLGSFLVFVWKDVAFSISAVLAFAAAGRLVALRAAEETGDTGGRARPIALLALAFVGLAVFRNNGFLAAAIAAPVLIIALRGVRRWVTVATVGPVLLSFALTGWLYPKLEIQGARPSLTYATAYADIAAAYARQPGTFTSADTALMTKVAPLWQWRAGANCYDSDWLTNRKPFHTRAADALNSRLVDLWIRTLKRTPGVVVGARMCRGSIAWRVAGGPARLDAETIIGGTKVGPTRFGWAAPGRRMDGNPYLPLLSIRPLSAPLHHFADSVRSASRASWLDWLLWRGALWCYLTYAVVAAYGWRRRLPAAAALVAMTAGIQLCVLAANPAQLFRYMAATIVLGVLALPLATVRRKRSEPRRLLDFTRVLETPERRSTEPELARRSAAAE